ncbi:M20/M25/M40 family metallo-hydrolase [Sphingomonas tabacisoli]|uniref:M20/M25/M40 family metallo-hydrolase n=1 Tax=Sphingomonas tabacisoli TaxID=2249466 RepID=A0ABW4I3J1_9SPHN
MDSRNFDRRALLQGAAAGAAFLAPGAALAQSGDEKAIRAAVERGHDASIKRLQEWIALPSIAAENRDMQKGAEHMAALAKDAGFQHVEIVPTSGHPGVFATLDAGAKKTVGLYFMYDVKQFDPSEWSSPPTEARIVDKPGMGRAIVGRGATNQKGPEATFLAALHAIRAAGRKPPVNFVLVAEGEEEIGSPHFAEIVRRPDIAANLKQTIGVFMPSNGQDPDGSTTVTLGSKGIIECELIATGEAWGRGPGKDVHSSLKASIDSPVWRLVQALQTLVSPDGNTVMIDGWNEHVRPLTAREKAIIAENARLTSEADEMKSLSVKHWIDDLPWQASQERLAAAPTANIEGLVAGYTGPGGKTILPHKGVAKMDFRLVPNQTHADCVAKLKAHLAKRGFGDIQVKVSGGYDPTETAEDSRLIQTEIATYKKLGVTPTLYPRNAGSWPGYVFTAPPLSLPAGHFGLGHGSGAHAPDEYYLIEPSNPKVAGFDAATMSYVEFLYALASART